MVFIAHSSVGAEVYFYDPYYVYMRRVNLLEEIVVFLLLCFQLVIVVEILVLLVWSICQWLVVCTTVRGVKVGISRLLFMMRILLSYGFYHLNDNKYSVHAFV